MTGALVLLAVLVLSTAFGLVHQRRSGRVRAAKQTTPAADVLAALGEQPGERATLLQFSSAFCAPCRATRRILADVAAAVPGVRHVEVDAEQHLDLVRRLDVSSTPTTLVLDAEGRIAARATGQPRKEAVLAAIAGALQQESTEM